MNKAAGLPLPRLSRGLFAPSAVASTASVSAPAAAEGALAVYTDESLFSAMGVRIAFTERSGGASGPPFASLNLKADLGDDLQAVQGNRRALFSSLGGAGMPFIIPRQVHGSAIVSVESALPGELEAAQQSADRGCDAVTVSCAGVGALLCYADCLPLIIVAPSGAFSIVHCGWRGTVAHLASRALRSLQSACRCDPGDVNAYIGPYIHAECFEVDEDLASRFAASFGEDSVSCKGGAFHVDLGRAVRADLAACGVARQRIADLGLCTACNTDRFFSYRAEGGTTGRHGAIAFKWEEGRTWES